VKAKNNIRKRGGVVMKVALLESQKNKPGIVNGSRKTSYPKSRFRPQTGQSYLIQRRSYSLSYKNCMSKKITLLCAPAGFGKTVLMAQWFEESKAAGRRCAWLNFDPLDDQTDQLLELLILSLKQCGINVKWQPGEVDDKAIGAIVNVLEDLDDEVTFFLDGQEQITQPECLTLLGRIIDCLPDNVKLVVASRVTPNWYKVELFLHDLFHTLTPTELRFSLIEIMRYSQEGGPYSLVESQAYKLASNVEGWPAAIKLAMIGLCNAKTQSEINQVLKGEFKLIYQYIENNIFKDIEEELRIFIYKTSHLGELKYEVCDAICEINNSEENIAKLVQRGLLKENQYYEHGYSYPIFISTYLKNSFSEHLGKEASALHERAADWYKDQEIPSAALYHALFLPNLNKAKSTVELFSEKLIVSGEINLINKFFDRLPSDELESNTQLLLVYVWVKIITQNFEDAQLYLAKLKSMTDGCRVDGVIGNNLCSETHLKVLKYRILQAINPDWSDPSVWIKLKNKEGDNVSFLKEQIELSLGAAYLRKERFDDAYNAFMEAARCAKINKTPITSIIALSKSAHIRMLEGRLMDAYVLCNDAIDLSLKNFGTSIPVIAVPLLLRSEINYELGNMSKAEEDHIESTKLFEKYKSQKFQFQAYIQGARLSNYHSGPAAAIGLLDRASKIMAKGANNGISSTLYAEKIKYYIQKNEIPMAESILRHEGISLDSSNPSPKFFYSSKNEAIYIAFCRYLIAVGRYDAASAWLTKMLHQAQLNGRNRLCLVIAGLLALAHVSSGDDTRAMRRTREMLLYGEHSSAYQSLRDLGPEVIKLVSKYHKHQESLSEKSLRGPSENYVLNFLSLDENDKKNSRGVFYKEKFEIKGRPIVLEELSDNILTQREGDVLQLIIDGYSNKGIAQELILGEGTVKWHVKNIFSKLNVSSRTQAASKGRAMKLFE
jgi:LuxR family maltose regulon positive regulatory protein